MSSVIGYNLVTDTEGSKKTIVSVQFDKEKQELFYHFMYSKKVKKRLYSYLSNSETGRPSHLSWHSNKFHMRLLKDKVIQEQYYDNFLSAYQDQIILLLIHSVYHTNSENFFLDRETDIAKKFELKVIKSISEQQAFTIILFLAPESKNIDDIQAEVCKAMKLPQDHGLGEVVLQENAWNGLKIVGFVTARALPYRDDTPLGKYFSGIVSSNVHLALQDLFANR